MYRAIRYVEQNPVRARMVKDAWEYHWSSARVLAGMAKYEEPLSINTSTFAMSPRESRKYLRAEDREMCSEMRLKTGKGLAIGSEGYVMSDFTEYSEYIKPLCPFSKFSSILFKVRVQITRKTADANYYIML